MNYIVVFVTASSQEEAEKIADGLVDSKLAACVNIIPNIKSIFMWQGKKDTASECLLIVKTKQACFGRLKKKVRELHSYDTPEIIAMPISEGDKDYLNWIEDTV